MTSGSGVWSTTVAVAMARASCPGQERHETSALSVRPGLDGGVDLNVERHVRTRTGTGEHGVDRLHDLVGLRRRRGHDGLAQELTSGDDVSHGRRRGALEFLP